MFVNQASQAEDSALGYGVGRSFADLPAGFFVETALVASSAAASFTSPRATAPERASIVAGGANAALAEYGDFVLARHGKSRPRGNHTAETTFLGYSTTGFYFYNLCDCTDPLPSPHKRTTCSAAGSALPGCSSYQDTLEAVHDALMSQRVPCMLERSEPLCGSGPLCVVQARIPIVGGGVGIPNTSQRPPSHPPAIAFAPGQHGLRNPTWTP